MDGLVQVLFLVGILLIFWLLVIRPASRRQRAQAQMQSAIEVGDRIVLTSGFFGTVAALLDDRLEVELAPGTTVTVARAAVGSVLPSGEPTTSELDDEDEVTAEHDVDGGPAAPSLEKRSTDTPESGER